MTKKPRISQKESNEFRHSVEDVQPLNKANTRESTKKPQKKSTRPAHTKALKQDEHIDDQQIPPINFELSSQKDWHHAQDCIHFAKSGTSHQLLRKMRRGQLHIDDQLDLHQMNRHKALNAMNRFIAKAQSNGLKNLLIIHGKGYDQAILKNLTSHYLQQDKRVLAFHSATPKDGGTGAVYVLIKSKPREHL